MLPEANTREAFAQALAQLQKRKMEALSLFRPMKTQEPALRALSHASEIVIRGGNRSGKTSLWAVIIAAAACRVPLRDFDGNVMEWPWPWPKDEKILIWLTGADEKHIGNTIYSKLFKPGAFDIIRDKDEWRVWRPWEPEDLERADEKVKAPPLIPGRLLYGSPKPGSYHESRSFAWEDKGKRIFTLCRLTNGTEIHAFPSGGAAPQGQAVHIIGIDEDIKIPSHVEEWQARLSDVKGKMLWAAWPHRTNLALTNMSRRAMEQRDREKPDVFEIVLEFNKNPYIDEDEKRKRLEGWSPEVRRSRDLGEFVLDKVQVFPKFNIDLHGIPNANRPNDPVEAAIEGNYLRPPSDWTNYLGIDPGHTNPAAVFLSVPPPSLSGEHGTQWIVWYAVLLNTIETADFVRHIKKIAGDLEFEAFYFDYRYGRQKPGGQIETIADQWSRWFGKERLLCNATRHYFQWGDDNPTARNNLVREALEPDQYGVPKLRVVSHNTYDMQQEFILYSKRVTKDDVKDDVDDKFNHTMDALGYVVSRNPEWVKPRTAKRRNPAVELMNRWLHPKKPPGSQSGVISIGMGAAEPETAQVI